MTERLIAGLIAFPVAFALIVAIHSYRMRDYKPYRWWL